MPHPAQVANIIAETGRAKSSLRARPHSCFSETQKSLPPTDPFNFPHIEEVVFFDCLTNDNLRAGNCRTYRLHRSVGSSRLILSAGRI